MILLATLLLAAFVALSILRPVLSAEDAPVLGEAEAEAVRLGDQRSRFLQMLRDLEFDHDTGKVSAEEHQRMRAALVADLSSIMKRLKELER
jgi:hypothetical protein